MAFKIFPLFKGCMTSHKLSIQGRQFISSVINKKNVTEMIITDGTVTMIQKNIFKQEFLRNVEMMQ